ncbi:MAG: peptidase S10 [Clostridia bacterium]|nr:peptidase S10 [Clostridia bacterium]
MRKRIALLIAVVLLTATLPTAVWSAGISEAAQAEAASLPEDASPAEGMEPGDATGQGLSPQDGEARYEDAQDNVVTTRHTAVIQGKELAYTAQAGTTVLETNGNRCEIFFTSYTLDGVEDPSERPVTFIFNGGPGSCSMYLHVGCFGPRRIDVDENGNAISLPARMVDNGNSLLDLTDLVVIDAVGCGYSRSLEDSNGPFIGYENDICVTADFIRQYVNRNNRWGSAKYIAGESYGTIRAVGVCKYLAASYSMNLNGLILISSANDTAGIVFSGGNDIPYATFIPTYAAIARYHGVLAREYQEQPLEDYLEEVRGFVEGAYVPALFQGNRLPEEERDALAEKLAGYIGLTKEFVLDHNLRIELEDFSKALLKDEKLMVGRLDGRVTGPVTSGSLDSGESDPSSSAVNLSYGNAFNSYVINELGFRTDRPYIPTNGNINYEWTFPIGSWGGFVSQEQTIYECISQNPFLKVWVLCGYYDAATPFYSAEWTFNHVFLNDALRDNLSFSYYQCGHMIYMEKQSFDKFRRDAEAWYK